MRRQSLCVHLQLAWQRTLASRQEREYPKTKTKTRTPLENALTLFDENGVIVLSDNPELIHLLQTKQWKRLFWENRSAVESEMQFIVFGHGLYEKALNPFLGMCGKALILPTTDDIDTQLADYLQENLNTPKQLLPLPILGVPGFDAANSEPAYYDNRDYFR